MLSMADQIFSFRVEVIEEVVVVEWMEGVE